VRLFFYIYISRKSALLNYALYLSVSSFGTQSVMLQGFLTSIFTNYGSFQTSLVTPVQVETVFICAIAASYGFSILCMITSTFCQVYAVSLAIRGPEGSLDKAIDGCACI